MKKTILSTLFLIAIIKCSLAQFLAPTTLLSNVPDPELTQIASFNSDGKYDLLVYLASNNKLRLYKDFHNQNDYTDLIENVSNCNHIKIIDYNNDGKMDIVYGQQNKINLLLNDGNYAFTPQELISLNSSYSVRAFELVDYNNDNTLDITVEALGGMWTESIIGAYYNNNSSFSQDTSMYIGGGINDPKIIADYIDDDNNIDFLYKTSAFNYSVNWVEYENNHFQFVHNWNDEYILNFYLFDYDNDDDKDLFLTTNNFGSYGIIYQNFGDGNFVSPLNRDWQKNLLFGDFNNDSLQDVIHYNSTIEWVKGEDGSILEATSEEIESNIDEISDLLSIDIDNDGDLDLVSVSNPQGKIYLHENNAIAASTKNLINQNNQITVFPNPTSGALNIQFEKAVVENTTFELFDVNGSKIKSYAIASGNTTLRIENLTTPPGFYTGKIISENSIIGSIKIILNN